MKIYSFIIVLFLCITSYGQDKSDGLQNLDSTSTKKNEKSFQIIENMPIYKGCENEKDNASKIKCMSQKLAELFKDNFNTTIPKDSDLKPGITSMTFIFKVGKEGEVTVVDVKAKDEYLKKEARRVAVLIPKFTPAYQRGKPVIVPFTLPLKVNLESNEEESTYPVYRGCDKDMTNEELKKCSKKKIMNFIKMSFDTGIADVALPLEKSTQFQLDFVINKKGKVEQINAKANHRAIAIEAIKVTKRLPKFKNPGTKNGKPVDVPFRLLMTIYF